MFIGLAMVNLPIDRFNFKISTFFFLDLKLIQIDRLISKYFKPNHFRDIQTFDHSFVMFIHYCIGRGRKKF